MAKRKKPVNRSGDAILLNGTGIYRRENILNIQEPIKPILFAKHRIPNIKEIRAIHHQGEIFLNAKDVALMMRKCSYKYNSVSVMNFVKRFILNLIQ